MFVVVAFLTRLYSGWSYVKARLDSPYVEYEETGWADGAVAKKVSFPPPRCGRDTRACHILCSLASLLNVVA